MDQKLIGILIGGVGAAVFFGLSGFLQKVANTNSISIGPYMTISGAAILLTGIATWLVTKECEVNFVSGTAAFMFGILWACGSILIAVALVKYNAPISQLAPLYNMNTLITVILGIVIFKEYKDVNLATLLPGVFFILIGGWLCSR
jgi:transporter family protein